MKFKAIVPILLIALILAACSQAQETSPTPTEVPLTETPTPLPPTETPTPTPAPTETPTPEPSPTPDLRVLNTTADQLAVTAAELPEEGAFIVEGQRGALSNEAIVYHVTQLLGAETGALAQAYVEESKRTTGYGVAFVRTNPAYTSPLRIYHEIAIFEDVAGAHTDVTVFKPALMSAFGRTPVEDHPTIGDDTNIYTEKITESGQELLVYLIEFSYRNTANEVAFWGIEGQYTLDDAVAIAQLVFDKLSQAPLAEVP